MIKEIAPTSLDSDRILFGLMARGISLEQAESERREIERDLADIRRPRAQRQLSLLVEALGADVGHPPAQRRPARSKELADALYAEADGRCSYCGTEMVWEQNHPDQMTIDHVVALAIGGTNERENLIAACRTCNSMKRTRSAESFRATLAR